MMWPFKKKTYHIEWGYDANPGNNHYTAIVKAKNIADAWHQIEKKHSLPISLISIEEVVEDGKIL